MACHEMLLQQKLNRREVRALDSTQSGGFPSARNMDGNSWRKMSPEEEIPLGKALVPRRWHKALGDC